MGQTIQYQLDTLGWMQFEYLVQVLLKAELGIGVEAWGGSADHGKDAYCENELNFPNRHETNFGPFVFQAKFVAGANAPNADVAPSLLAAVSKEAELIQKRISSNKWSIAQHYALFTNAPVSADLKSKLRQLLANALPTTAITIQGATDICALIDINMSITRSFPQLLSLRSLTELLHIVVRNRWIQRSNAVIGEAEELAHVFVPTTSYDKAWKVLAKHSFVVLEGPPEMGKSAIAWMIAAAQLADGWEAVDCDIPEDFFDNLSDDRDQVFIADDAFGTTEYDTTRGSNWGRQLHKILPRLDSKHWLIWTSRMHILKRALQEMSLQGRAAKFPKPAEVVVNASSLEREERALILYRHARAGQLESSAKNIIRQNASAVVDNRHFTPERIRRFVSESLPELSSKLLLDKLTPEDVTQHIIRAIERPTDRMRKTFSKLEEGQKWLLIAMLDCGRNVQINDLQQAYRRFYPQVQKPIDDDIQMLKEAFIEESKTVVAPVIQWIHPSYRDLVIQELEKDEVAASRFLASCSANGLQLAISVAGGAKGERQFPLMKTKQSWALLAKRFLALVEIANLEYETTNYLGMIRGALESCQHNPEIRAELAEILRQCCSVIKTHLDTVGEPLQPRLLEEFFVSSMCLVPPANMPSLVMTWQDVDRGCAEAIEKFKKDSWNLDADAVLEWATVIKIISKSDARILIQAGFPDVQRADAEQLCKFVREEASADYTLDEADEYYSEAQRLGTLATALRELVGVFPQLDQLLEEIAQEASSQSDHLEYEYRDKLSESAEDIPGELRSVPSSFDLERLFSDL